MVSKMSWRAKFHSLGLTMGEIVVFICNFYFGHVHARQQLGSWFVHHLLCSLYNSPADKHFNYSKSQDSDYDSKLRM